jgi:hypothetical protein
MLSARHVLFSISCSHPADQNQIIAAIISLRDRVVFFRWFSLFPRRQLGDSDLLITSPPSNIWNISRGVIDTQPITFYLSDSRCWRSLTGIQSRKWRL